MRPLPCRRRARTCQHSFVLACGPSCARRCLAFLPLVALWLAALWPGSASVLVASAKSAGTSPPTAPAAEPSAPQAKQQVPEARSYVLVDANTGNVLAGYHEHLRVPPASLTKVVTALIAVGYLAPSATVDGTGVSESAYPNQVGMEKGVPWPLDEVLGSLLVYSANDAAYAIAQRIGGSLAGFVPIMQLAASQMRLADHPSFHDPAGLDGPEGFRGGNLVSARDLATAGRDLLAVPLLAQIVKDLSYDFVDPTRKPHDLPSMDYSFLSSYAGAIGIKTGFTDRAGDCLLAAARRGGRTMIAVVMDGYNPTQTATLLLNQGFATPVADEPTYDRLPPVLLPGPRFASQREAAEGAGGRHSTRAAPRQVPPAPSGSTANRKMAAASLAAPPSEGQRKGQAAPPRPAQAAHSDGLSSVLGSWPAELLVMFSTLAALFAFWETATTNKKRRRAPPAMLERKGSGPRFGQM
jgi:D-alanyl-D-alanine carboxypeptidase